VLWIGEGVKLSSRTCDMVMVVDMVVVVGNGCEQCRGTAMVESGHGRGHGRGMVCVHTL
jgi:hypothetical protein